MQTRSFIKSFLAFALVAVTSVAQAQQVLRVTTIPEEAATEQIRKFGPLSQYLEKSLGMKVEFTPVTDYPAAVEALVNKQVDLVWFGGLTGVQARLQTPGAKVLAQRDVDAAFHSIFIGNANSFQGIKPIRGFNDLQQFKGKRFTFGSESSTSGRLMPQYFLSKGGVQISDFAGGAPGFSGSHDATIALVQSGALARILRKLNDVPELWIPA